MKTFIAGAALATVLLTTAAHAGVSPEDFQIKTTGELAKLCSDEPTDPDYMAAIHFCQGFGSGVFQTEQLHQAASRARPLYCSPKPMPTRDEAIAGFVKWVHDTPKVADDTPAAGVLQYLMATYPCPTKR